MAEQKKAHSKESQNNKALPVRVKSEVNFLILPYFSLDKDADVNRRLEFSEIRQRGNEMFEIFWTVIPHPDFGLPRDFERRLQRAIEYSLSGLPRPITNPVPLPGIRELSRLMGVTCNGRFAEKVKNGLTIMMMTAIISKRSYYNKSKKAWLDERFHLYDKIVFKNELLSDGQTAERNYAFFTNGYLDNLNSLYVRPIDFDYLKSLRPISSRLYEILGVKFYGHRDFIMYRYSTLCKILPLKQQKTLARARQQLQGANDELKETEFLSLYIWLPIRDVNDDWYIRYEPGDRFFRELEAQEREFAGPSKNITPKQKEIIPLITDKTDESNLGHVDEEFGAWQSESVSGDEDGSEVNSLWSLFSEIVRQYPEFDLRGQDREWFQQRVQENAGWNSLNLQEELRNWGDWLDTEHRKKIRGEANRFPQSNFRGNLMNWLNRSLNAAIKNIDNGLVLAGQETVGRKGWDLPSDYRIDIM